MNQIRKTRINDQIQVDEVRLIDVEGKQQGVVTIEEALRQAQEAHLDLVEISPNVEPPVCRIMDFSKYKFERSKRSSAARKKQKQVKSKEIKFRPNTAQGDYDVKLKRICKFLLDGDRVKISIQFRGRQIQHKEFGMELIERIKTDLPKGYLVEQQPKLEGRQIMMVVILGKSNGD